MWRYFSDNHSSSHFNIDLLNLGKHDPISCISSKFNPFKKKVYKKIGGIYS